MTWTKRQIAEAEEERQQRKRESLLLDARELAEAWIITGDDRLRPLIWEEVSHCWGPKAAVTFLEKGLERGVQVHHVDGRIVRLGNLTVFPPPQ